MAMAPVAIVVLVGPGSREEERLVDLMASVYAWEPRAVHWVLVDDALSERRLLTRLELPKGSSAITLPHPRPSWPGRSPHMGLGAGTIMALRYARARTSAAFVFKLDTDALAIGPFVEATAAIVARERDAAVIGAYGDSCNPAGRDTEKLRMVSPLVPALDEVPDPPSGVADPDVPISGPYGSLSVNQMKAFGRLRPHVGRAVANGYRLLEYCQGGALAVTTEFIDRMAERGYLEAYEAWGYLPFGDDVILGLYARAVGLRLIDCCGPGQPFGIQWLGLPYDPAVLIANGHGLVASVKGDPNHSEPALRAYFSGHRAAARMA
jgi:hypothetical protein